MIFYLSIYLALAIIGIGTSIPLATAGQVSIAEILLAHFLTVLFCGLATGFALLVTRPLCKKYFKVNSKYNKVSAKEIKFLNLLKVKKWKDYVPDLGCLSGFKKDMNNDLPKNADYFARFIFESVAASWLHLTAILLSPLFFLMLNPKLFATIGTTTLLISFILNFLPVLVQRYNRPRLLKIYLAYIAKEKA